jgi:hypothetical protein
MNIRRSALIPLTFAILTLTACASGSAIVTGTKRPPIAVESVKLYPDPPADFEVIGVISAISGAGLTEQGSVDYAVAELKHQAAMLGANGILIVSTGGGGGHGKTVEGKAIFVKGP